MHGRAYVNERPIVLIADDDRSAGALYEAALQREGFNTVLAGNGQEVLARLDEQPFDLLLLDLHMPLMDGLQTLLAIRASGRLHTLPVIMLTGAGDEADRIRGLESGADDYLQKPVGIAELAARVRAQLRGHQAWADEIEQTRSARRRLAGALEGLHTEMPLLTIASTLAERLPATLGVDGVAILHFGADAVTTVASSGVLGRRFRPNRRLPERLGRQLHDRALTGPWLDAKSGEVDRRSRALDVAYVPFRLGSTADPLGLLAYAQETGGASGPLSRRLPDLIDATDLIVVVLRPAVERAETANASISRIQRVIAERQFAIHLQPIVRLEGGELVAVEALTRFADDTAPEALFGEAATFGLGAALERAAIEAAIDVAGSLPPEVALSVNVSADALQHDSLLHEVLAGVDRALIVELTEHERIDDYAGVRAALERLGPGVKLAIDDAGSGFASLRHIFALRPDYVKFDIEWVRGIDRDPVRRALVSGLVYFGSETGCELIAEGIETEAELAALRDLGIRLGQGYLLGRPQLGQA
jgi:EAL domain-containing protein (putative c-di-GMP-specific phosphodiesterase class I)/DNA-binding NarL/FixJ family response regulator